MRSENTCLSGDGTLQRLLQEVTHIHFIGICGAGMRVLARMCLGRGYTVTGSDSTPDGEGGLALSLAGVAVEKPCASSSIIAADMAVYSTAVPKDHPELCVAAARGIPAVSRADLLGALMLAFRVRIGVAGTHGKSTVSAMCAAILAAAGCDPTAAVGARLAGGMDGYREGGEDYFVFEACEYRHAFLSFHPTVAVLTNAEWDHPDCFPDKDSVIRAFGAYLRLPSVTVAAVSQDDEGARAAAEGVGIPLVSFGLSAGADVRAIGLSARPLGYAFTLSVYGRPAGEVTLGVPGLHNLQNALAAAAAAIAAGIPAEMIPAALSGFAGIGRRTELRGSYRGVRYYDDYAHHPTEIRAALSALATGRGRLIAIYQPHTYSRTAELFSDFKHALSLADLVVLTDVYAAREERIAGGTSQELAAALGKRAVYFPSPEAASLYVRSIAKEGDVVAVMGAGDLSARVFCGVLSFGEG